MSAPAPPAARAAAAPPAGAARAANRATNNVNVREFTPLISPAELATEIPASEAAQSVVQDGRERIKRVLAGEDDRLLCVVGPCSIHDERAALEYAGKLKAVADDTADRLLIVMRVYFEKPRTTVGWKGLISDPGLNEKFDMAEGLRKARADPAGDRRPRPAGGDGDAGADHPAIHRGPESPWPASAPAPPRAPATAR